MSNETEFVEGLIVKAPRDGAPDFVIGSLSIKRAEMIAWLTAREGDWINVDIKEAKSGKWYAAVDNWKPNKGGEPATNGGGPARREAGPRTSVPPQQRNDDPFPDDDIPFVTNRSVW